MPTPITRRAMLAATGGLAAGALLVSPARAALTIKGKILETYNRAGGAAVLGAPLANEVKVTIHSHNTYGQRFERGQVWWGSGVGRWDLPAGARVRLTAGKNFRPVLGVRSVWRTDDLDGLAPLEERIVRDLGIRTMVAMNTGGDPSISGVTRLRYTVSNSGSHLEFYRGYVSRSGSRSSFGKVWLAVAGSSAPIVLHCSAGKDRTGWASDVLQAVAGVPKAPRDADYLATRNYSGDDVDLDWLNAARAELVKRYGTLGAYLAACGLNGAAVDRLRARLV